MRFYLSRRTGLAHGDKAGLIAAWSAWETGEIAKAQALARDALAAQPGSDEARHLLFLTAFVSGDYRGALDHHQSIDARYRRLEELTDPVIEGYVHLGAIADAVVFARGSKAVRAVTVQRLEEHAHRPFGVDLAGVAVVPFADAPFGEWFPALKAEINGQALTAHVDTGGSFIHMGPDRARALDIKTVKYGTDRAHLTSMRVGMSYGIAERFVLGDAVLRNVPVDVLDTLRGDGDLVIFGTNVLEQFLSTMDYPARRLILSKRGDSEAAAAHRGLLPVDGVNVPFHLWGAHQMCARGGLGPRNDLNWFVDSGFGLRPPGRQRRDPPGVLHLLEAPVQAVGHFRPGDPPRALRVTGATQAGPARGGAASDGRGCGRRSELRRCAHRRSHQPRVPEAVRLDHRFRHPRVSIRRATRRAIVNMRLRWTLRPA